MGIGGNDDRDRVRDASPIDQVVGEYGVSLVPDGRGWKALCPFHREKSASFKLDAERGTYRCFGCSEHGDVFSFVMKMENVEFPTALRMLAERSGIELAGRSSGPRLRPDEKQADRDLVAWAEGWFVERLRGPEGEAARRYLADRGFEDETIRTFRVGFAPAGWSHMADAMRAGSRDLERGVRLGLLKRSEEGRVYDAFRGRVMFPIREPRGTVIGFGGRHLEGVGPAERRSDPPPKYINSPESDLFHKGRVLYGHREGLDPIRRARELLLMEGYTDVMMAHQAGFPTAVATLGTALTVENVERVSRIADRVTLVFDGDRAGIEAARKAAVLFAPYSTEARVVLLAEGADPADLLRVSDGAERFRAALAEGVESHVFVLDRCFESENSTTAAGRDRAARAFYQYLDGIPSGIVRSTLLDRLAARLGQPYAVVERDHRERGSTRRPRGEEETTGTSSEVLPHEEEGILLCALTGAPEAAVVFRLLPPRRFRDPVLGRVAARIDVEGTDFDALRIDDPKEKSKALELIERRQDLGIDAETAMRSLVELVRRHLALLARVEQERFVAPEATGSARTEWIRRIAELRRLRVELGARPPQEPGILIEVLDRFEPGPEH